MVNDIIPWHRINHAIYHALHGVLQNRVENEKFSAARNTRKKKQKINDGTKKHQKIHKLKKKSHKNYPKGLSSNRTNT